MILNQNKSKYYSKIIHYEIIFIVIVDNIS